MKKLFLSLLLVSSFAQSMQNWPQQSPEALERKMIMLQIAKIKEQFNAMGGSCGGSSATSGAIVAFLQNLNTPVSYQIYLEMKKNGQL